MSNVQCPDDTVQTWTVKVDQAWKLKCTTAVRGVGLCGTVGGREYS